MDSMESELQTQAQSNGFDTVDAMIQSDFGAGVTYADYLNYMTLYYTAYMYYSQEYANLDISREVLEQYYDEHKDTFESDGVLKDDSPATINVRHILIAPEGGTTDDDGQTTYSDEEWAAAEAKAQEILDQWKAGEATEESFTALAQEYSVDPGSASNGGLYEDVAPGDMVEEFNDWCFEDGRTPGDTGIVKTKFGYHIMYFVSASEQLYWEAQAESQYRTEMGDKMLTDPMDNNPYEADYSKIVLGPAGESDGDGVHGGGGRHPGNPGRYRCHGDRPGLSPGRKEAPWIGLYASWGLRPREKPGWRWSWPRPWTGRSCPVIPCRYTDTWTWAPPSPPCPSARGSPTT